MAPPNRVENEPLFSSVANETCDPSRASCLPLQDIQESISDLLVSEPEAGQFVPVDDAAPLASYSRPIRATQPQSILTRSCPMEAERPRFSQRLVRELGLSLTEVLERASQNNEPFPSELRVLARQLSKGRLPTADYVSQHHELFDRSYQNADIDFLVHAVAVMVPGTQPIHATALSLNPRTQYYLTHRFSENSNDWVLQQGLIASLSQSNSSEARNLVSTVPPSLRSQPSPTVAQNAGGSSRSEIFSGGVASSESPISTSERMIEGVRVGLSAAFRVAQAVNPASAAIEGVLLARAVASGEGPLPITFWQDTLIFPESSAGGNASIPGLPYSNILPVAQINPPDELLRFENSIEEIGSFLFGTREQARLESFHADRVREDASPGHTNTSPLSSPAATAGLSQTIVNRITHPDPATQVIMSLSSPLLSSALSAATVLQGSSRFNLLSTAGSGTPLVFASLFAPHGIPAVTGASELHADSDTSHHSGSDSHSSGGDSSHGREGSEDEHRPSQEQDSYLV